MQLVYTEQETKAKYVILETSDREIIDQFIDYETGYLIVEETNKVDSSDNSVYSTVIEVETGNIISPEERLKQIVECEKIIIDSDRNLKFITRRRVNEATGSESIEGQVIDILTEKEIMSMRRTAFSRLPEKDIVESYNERIQIRNSQQKEYQDFWNKEYPSKTLEEKQAFWVEYIYRLMRMQGESGDDIYDIFSKKSYQEWKSQEPNIDLMLDYVIQAFTWDIDSSKVKLIIDKAIGRYKNSN